MMPDAFWNSLAPTVAALAALVVAFRTSGKVDAVHRDINSRLTEMLEAVRKAAFLAGSEDARTRAQTTTADHAAGVEEQRAKGDPVA